MTIMRNIIVSKYDISIFDRLKMAKELDKIIFYEWRHKCKKDFIIQENSFKLGYIAVKNKAKNDLLNNKILIQKLTKILFRIIWKNLQKHY